MIKSVVAAFAVLCLFIFTGSAILRFLGIQPGSFFIAGGILMFIVSKEREDVSIFPLAIPMLAGPGAITTVLLYVSEDKLPGLILPVLSAPPRLRSRSPRRRCSSALSSCASWAGRESR